VTDLDLLALAIVQAASFIKSTGTSIEDYAQILASEDGYVKLLDEEFTDPQREGVPNSVMKTWLISMRQIAERDKLAEKILYTIAYLDSQDIPYDLLEAIAGTAADRTVNLIAARKAIGQLMAFSFLQKSSTIVGSDLYTLHRLVQLSVRLLLDSKKDEAESECFVSQALQLVNRFFPSGEHGTWDECEKYLPHLLSACKLYAGIEHCFLKSNLLERAHLYCFRIIQFSKSEEILGGLLEFWKQEGNPNHPNIYICLANLAELYSQQGRLSKAEEIGIQTLVLQNEVLGLRHPDTLNSMGSLAAIYSQQGRLSEAEEISIQTLELRKKKLGPRHPDTLRSMANLTLILLK
jgi:tetratricopeptide (TPR) repeat protein